jgi:hypothetical protein
MAVNKLHQKLRRKIFLHLWLMACLMCIPRDLCNAFWKMSVGMFMEAVIKLSDGHGSKWDAGSWLFNIVFILE